MLGSATSVCAWGPMSIESQSREKLRKIEALFAGASTAGERLAAEAALERVRGRLADNGIRRSKYNSQCQIAGRDICFSLFVGAMDWRRIAIIASGATRLWYGRPKASLIRCCGRSFPSSTARFKSIYTK